MIRLICAIIVLLAAAAPAAADQAELEALRAKLASQQNIMAQQSARLVELEAKVGMPTSAASWTWFIVGILGEGVFFMRFVVQWWASEKKKRTVVPMAFWHLSLIGTAMVLAYSVYIVSWVFILAYSLNVFLYVRNLAIARRAAAVVPEAAHTP
jgi:lipid-A-disaccharide synthase-like uncharacterized protein